MPDIIDLNNHPRAVLEKIRRLVARSENVFLTEAQDKMVQRVPVSHIFDCLENGQFEDEQLHHQDDEIYCNLLHDVAGTQVRVSLILKNDSETKRDYIHVLYAEEA